MREHDENPREESGVHRLAALLRKEATEIVDTDRDRLAWQRLLLATHEDDELRMGSRKVGRLWMLVPAAAGVLLLAAAMFHVFSKQPRLQFTVDGHEPTDSYLMSEVGRPRRVDFSDGSSLVLHAATHLRVTTTYSDGATLSLERGELDLSIRHRAKTRWQLDIGPYVVQVTGTHFSASWDPDAGDVGVDLLDGAVTVRGPGIVAPIILQVGQRFRANKAGSYTVETTGPAMALPEPPTEAPIPQATSPSPKTRRSASAAQAGAAPSRPEKPSCDFIALVSSGQFDATLAHARTMGIETAFAECPARSLFALADAARYQGQFELSRRALMAIRKRSPDDSGKAAFFLGRLEEARGNFETALGWYTQAMQGKTERQYFEEAKAGRERIGKRTADAPTRPSRTP
jgi:ferric-dicitrate binding protein FerR (iron transport regulator)